MTLAAVSIACCTRDRPSELRRFVESLIAARARVPDLTVELLVVDDDALPDQLLQALADQAGNADIHWTYHNKRQRQGLFRSRIEAIALATHAWIIFFDDDVEIEPDYLSRFVEAIDCNPGLTGLGGIDVLAASPSVWKIAGCIACGLEPLRVGRLSYGGFPAQIGRLHAAQQPFASLRLYGCNMAFRQSALRGIAASSGYQGYSLYEDAHLSFAAGRFGRLQIDPKLRVRHHHSPSSRDDSYDIGRTSILNHWELLKLYDAGASRRAGAVVSILCWIVWSVAKGLRHGLGAKNADLDFARGQLAALKTVLMG